MPNQLGGMPMNYTPGKTGQCPHGLLGYCATCNGPLEPKSSDKGSKFSTKFRQSVETGSKQGSNVVIDS